MAETEPESVREELGYTLPNDETTKRIKKLLNQPQPETGNRDPEAGLPTTEEAAEYGLPGVKEARRKIQDLPDNPSPSSR